MVEPQSGNNFSGLVVEMNSMKPFGCTMCLAAIGEKHANFCFRRGTTYAGPLFVAVGSIVMRGGLQVARAISKTMAKRIANALNKHIPNREGV